MNLSQIIKLFLPFWSFFIIILVIIAVTFIFDLINTKPEGTKNEFPYEKKLFLFDSVSELNLYKILLELFGDKYHIFVQINYGHLIRTKDAHNWGDRSRID